LRARTIGARGVVLQPPLIATQPVLDPQGGLVRARIGIGRHAFDVQRHARIQMHDAFRVEAEALFAYGGVTGVATVKKFLHDLGNAIAHPRSQRFADVDVLARDAKQHRSSPSSTLAARECLKTHAPTPSLPARNTTDRCQSVATPILNS